MSSQRGPRGRLPLLFNLKKKIYDTLAAMGPVAYPLIRLLHRPWKAGYARVHPLALYAPWTSDQEFISAYEIVKRHTLVDLYRCYALWSQLGRCGKIPGAILEVGVWRGGTGVLMALQARRCGFTEPVYLCDTFSGVVKSGGRDSAYEGGEHADTSRAEVARLVEASGLQNVQILEGVFPDETAGRIADERIRFGHIDVDVYQSARDAAEWVWPRLSPGGMLVFDDYGFISCDGVTQFVNEFSEREDATLVHNLNGHGVIIKFAK